MCLAFVASQNHEFTTKFDLTTVQGHDRGVSWKLICDFLLVINSNFGRIS